MNMNDEIKLLDLFPFGVEREQIGSSLQLFFLFLVAFPNFFYLATFVFRIVAKQPLFDSAVFTSKKNGCIFCIERTVFWIERVTIVWMPIHGNTLRCMLLTHAIFLFSNSVYYLSFRVDLESKKKSKMEQLAKTENNPNEEIVAAYNKTQTNVSNDIASNNATEKNDDSDLKINDSDPKNMAHEYKEEEDMQSFVDRMQIDMKELEAIFDNCWHGRHPPKVTKA